MTMVITSDVTNSELSVADTTDPLTAASARVTRGPSGETREEAAQAGVEESEGAVTMTAAAVVEVTVVKDTRLLRVDVTEPEICLLRINAWEKDQTGKLMLTQLLKKTCMVKMWFWERYAL